MKHPNFLEPPSPETIHYMHYFKVPIIVLTSVKLEDTQLKVTSCEPERKLKNVTVLSLCFMALVFCSKDNSRLSAFSLRRVSKLSKSFAPSFLVAFFFFCKCRLRECRTRNTMWQFIEYMGNARYKCTSEVPSEKTQSFQCLIVLMLGVKQHNNIEPSNFQTCEK